MTTPTLEEVRNLLVLMLDNTRPGWIGEGEEIARELLDYIDGKSPESPQEWAAALATTRSTRKG